ncbi:hypothetical protein [Sphaerisporangium flaviroseum]
MLAPERSRRHPAAWAAHRLSRALENTESLGATVAETVAEEERR